MKYVKIPNKCKITINIAVQFSNIVFLLLTLSGNQTKIKIRLLIFDGAAKMIKCSNTINTISYYQCG